MNDIIVTSYWTTNSLYSQDLWPSPGNINIKGKNCGLSQELREEATRVVWVKYVWFQNIPELGLVLSEWGSAAILAKDEGKWNMCDLVALFQIW